MQEVNYQKSETITFKTTKGKKKHDGTNLILKQFVLIKMVQSVNT